MPITKRLPTRQPRVVLDTRQSKRPRLVVQVPLTEELHIRQALEQLSRTKKGISAQAVVLDALCIAAEQTYFWTPEWQAKERSADQAIANKRVRTFGSMEEMLEFLDQK
ncbi:MAG: hypothetical protein HY327_04135 [Chloroflexi bacterium]|nr:hypothetical protein [Chloroflexota bacterium]